MFISQNRKGTVPDRFMNLSVGEIATEIGYTNPNKFTSAFRGEYGMTPTEYKKNV